MLLGTALLSDLILSFYSVLARQPIDNEARGREKVYVY